VAAAQEDEPLPPPVRPGELKAFKGQAIENPCLSRQAGRCLAYALDPFYERLGETYRQEPGAVTRVIHFGDSIVASDYVSARVRRRLATTFGDAGHGFLSIGQSSRWYYQEDVAHQPSQDWTVQSVTGRTTADRLYGLAGSSFESAGPGARASFGTVRGKDIGGSVGRFDVYYLEQPGGGPVAVSIDGKAQGEIQTAGKKKASAYKSFAVTDGPHTLTLTSAAAKARLFGVVMEREEPGIVYDSVGLVGGSAWGLLAIEPAHWEGQLVQRDPALVILMFGTNEARFLKTSEKALAEYQATQEALIARLREALPNSACLLMSPLDSATKRGGALVTRPAVPKMIAAQRQAAVKAGCAFWDTFTWMGGEGAMAAWYRKGMAAADLAHPSKQGADRIGDAFFEALLHGYDRYAARRRVSLPLQ
jgi:lysophospholipase L1-like esterase